MHLNIILLLSAAAFMPGISAYRQSKDVALYHRQAGQSATLSAAATSTTAPTSTTSLPANEFIEPFSITLDGQIFPPSIHILGLDSATAPDFSINCINCVIGGNVSLSGGGNYDDVYDIAPPPDVLEIPSDFNFEDHWVAATFDNFEASFDLSIGLNVSSPVNEIIVPIPFTKTVTKTEGPLTLSATLGMVLHGWVNTTIDVNLTYGFDLSVPRGSEILIDLSQIENSTSLGFNKTRLNPHPFNSIRNDIDIDLELSFRPSVTFVVSVNAPVDLDVPKLDVEIQQVHNVTANCDPATSSTPTDEIFQNATLLVPSVGFDAIEIVTGDARVLVFKGSKSHSFEESTSVNLTTACYFLDKAKKTSVPAADATPSQSLAVGFRAPLAMTLLTMIIVGSVQM